MEDEKEEKTQKKGKEEEKGKKKAKNKIRKRQKKRNSKGIIKIKWRWKLLRYGERERRATRLAGAKRSKVPEVRKSFFLPENGRKLEKTLRKCGEFNRCKRWSHNLHAFEFS